ncbi:MAG: (Fe-S)-binding protein [Anaerolineales bacterium]|nr:(Fe-S)-binding protein [Anaerolineales bacterium]
MLTLTEKILFALAVLASGYATLRATQRLVRIIGAGQGKTDWSLALKRLPEVLARIVVFQPVFRLRFVTSLLHGLVGWGFGFYLLVNLFDVLRAYIPGFEIPGRTGDIYRLLADLLSAGVLIGMVALLVRRFMFQPRHLTARSGILLNAKARAGIRRDSLIVGVFILLHVGFRLLGESFHLAGQAGNDPWQPVASSIAPLFSGLSYSTLEVMVHISFWIALGLILAFIPYFPYSKHIHLFFAPLNYLLKPKRRSIGELAALDFEDERIEQFGASNLADLGWEQMMDAYACIMCYRCQEVCPAYNTGKVLSPATLEINKRYLLNGVKSENIDLLSETPLLDQVITAEAVWACTTCGACIDICPVGNEPMRDILDIRRSMVLMENNFPEQLQTAFRGMERTMNPWNIPPQERLKWAEGLDVPTINEKPDPEYLWWVGCAPATDVRAQKTARALAKILHHARIDFAVLGELESCTGDSARRAGNEYLFFELASANVETLNQLKTRKILTTCPHCLHTLQNEYPAFGGHYEVIHHSELIAALLASGRLHLHQDAAGQTLTFHDPCYLGRQNGILEAPRLSLQQTGSQLLEMPRSKAKSFCCGAGGAQMWKEEEPGETAVNLTRFEEARSTGANTLAVGCPFCLTMLTDAAKQSSGSEDEKPVVLDIAEIVAAQLEN